MSNLQNAKEKYLTARNEYLRVWKEHLVSSIKNHRYLNFSDLSEFLMEKYSFNISFKLDYWYPVSSDDDMKSIIFSENDMKFLKLEYYEHEYHYPLKPFTDIDEILTLFFNRNCKDAFKHSSKYIVYDELDRDRLRTVYINIKKLPEYH